MAESNYRLNIGFSSVLKRMIEDSTTTNKDRSILLTFLGLYQREIDVQAAVKNLFKGFIDAHYFSSSLGMN